MPRIMLVEDDDHVRESLNDLLAESGFELILASNGQQALELLARENPDLVILDIVMPEMDGLELCRRIRSDPFLFKLPILFLTARGRSSDIEKGLDMGGDDYLVKPFEANELLARIRALLRRMPGKQMSPESDFLAVGDLRLHSMRPEIQVGKQLFKLTDIEHRIMHYLMLNAGRPLSVDQLLEDIWEYPPGVGDPKLVYVTLGRLRDKIEPDAENPSIIRNVRGRGYLVDN